jgi:ribosome biogenesis GTPase A
MKIVQPKFNWYPGHMARAIREIQKKLKAVDIVVEIRDARVPLVSGNAELDKTLGNKNRLILINKVNLADTKTINLWEEWFSQQNSPYAFINCFDKQSLKRVIAQAKDIVERNRLASNPELTTPKTKLRMMILGLPNTGKSTIINQLAGKSATKTANKPGQTQSQQWIIINEFLELLDTPGVMPPHVETDEHVHWLSAIHAIPDSVLGEEVPAVFLVNYFLKHKTPEFLAKYKLANFDLSLEEAFTQIAKARGCIRQKGLPDFERVYKLLLADFRAGDLGKFCFELPPN